MDHRIVGLNLHRIRKEKKLSQEKAAEISGISRLTYSKIENNQSIPRVATLQQIAGALNIKMVDLLSPVHQLEHVRFRSLKRMNSRPSLLNDVSLWLTDYSALESLLHNSLAYKFKGFSESIPKHLSGIEMAEWSALKARELLGLTNREPIYDMAGLIESSGIKLCRINLASNDFFGLSVAADNEGPAIVVNVFDRIPVERWIFSTARELGHLLIHQDSYVTEQSEEINQQEIEANQFASYFLMPEESFQAEWNDSRGLSLVDRVLKIKRIFRVSYKTVLYRLMDQYGNQIWNTFNYTYKSENGIPASVIREIDSLSPYEYAYAPENLRSQEIETLVPSDFQNERLAGLVRTAIENEQISISRGAEMLKIDLYAMRSIMASWV